MCLYGNVCWLLTTAALFALFQIIHKRAIDFVFLRHSTMMDHLHAKQCCVKKRNDCSRIITAWVQFFELCSLWCNFKKNALSGSWKERAPCLEHSIEQAGKAALFQILFKGFYDTHVTHSLSMRLPRSERKSGSAAARHSGLSASAAGYETSEAIIFKLNKMLLD